MEYIGRHCGVKDCKQLDFLPFKCEGCKVDFCHEHRKFDDHTCPKKPDNNRIAPQCPLCQKYLAMDLTQTYDAIVDAHISSGCQDVKAKKLRVHACAVPGCKKKEMVPVTCAHCHLNYCLTHRQTLDHNCEQIKKNHQAQREAKQRQAGRVAVVQARTAARDAQRQEREDSGLGPNGKPVTEAQRRRREQLEAIRKRMKESNNANKNRGHSAASPIVIDDAKPTPLDIEAVITPITATTTTSTTTTTTTTTTTMTSTERRVRLMKVKRNAQGSKRIPANKRFYLRVLYRRGTETRAQDMFFDKEWTIGRVLDVAAESSGLENMNNNPKQPKLSIYTVQHWAPLPTDVPLSLLTSADFQQGDSVVLEYDNYAGDSAIQQSFMSVVQAS
eukprot:TRINITY_DN1191_c0_g1_i1.p1 TRINITY_DN1191_c0_g1~~TRINITY_DN1191_c0_g1_i1.p1  ORF type:complete len:387 (+),score=79.50 TRINITY_DN1191_c0_g1_i1:1130-2290(+)